MKLCDLETSKALQELGYDGEYAKSYTDFGNPTIDITTSLLYPTEIPAPRLDDAAYFLRDRYRIFIDLYPDLMSADPLRSLNWEIFMLSCDMCGSIAYGTSTDYDSALEAAVTKAIEIIKTRKK